MLFCPDCGSIMMPKEEGRKALLVCHCGYSHVEKEDILMRETVRTAKKLEVVDEKVKKVLPKAQQECSKCGYKEAYFWSQQTRASDEPETQFFECVKCAHRWRKYD